LISKEKKLNIRKNVIKKSKNKKKRKARIMMGRKYMSHWKNLAKLKKGMRF